MNENNIRLAIFYIPPVVGATIFLIKWQAGRIAAKKELAAIKVRETSVGETKIQELMNQIRELTVKLGEAKIERNEMKADLIEMKEEFKYFKNEIRTMIDTIRHHGMEDINNAIDKLERLNKNK